MIFIGGYIERTNFMSQTRLYSILWLLIFGVLYSFFESKGWGILSTLSLIMASLSGLTLIRTFIHF